MLQSATGEIDDEKVRKNMDLAMEAYISRVNHCRCGNSSIHLFRGADASVHLGTRDDLLTFLKGSKSAKESSHHHKNPFFTLSCPDFQFLSLPQQVYCKVPQNVLVCFFARVRRVNEDLAAPRFRLSWTVYRWSNHILVSVGLSNTFLASASTKDSGGG